MMSASTSYSFVRMKSWSSVCAANARTASKNQSVASTVLYSGVSPASGNRLGSIPRSTLAAKASRIPRAASNRPVASVEPRQRDHRVAAPIAEPMVSGNDGAFLSAPHNELIGGLDQRSYERIVRGRSRQDICTAAGLAPNAADRQNPQARASVDATTDARRSRRKSKVSTIGLKRSSAVVESALFLHRVFEVAVPVAGLPNFARRCGRGRDSGHPWYGEHITRPGSISSDGLSAPFS